MSYLLDTDVIVWWFMDKPLSTQATHVLNRLESQVFVSPVTAWEINVKAKKGHVELRGSYLEAINECGFEILNVSWAHAVAAAELPLHHKDPFDRLLVGQAAVEGFTLVSRDACFAQYEVPLIEA